MCSPWHWVVHITWHHIIMTQSRYIRKRLFTDATIKKLWETLMKFIEKLKSTAQVVNCHKCSLYCKTKLVGSFCSVCVHWKECTSCGYMRKSVTLASFYRYRRTKKKRETENNCWRTTQDKLWWRKNKWPVYSKNTLDRYLPMKTWKTYQSQLYT